MCLNEFLGALAKVVKPNPATLVALNRTKVEASETPVAASDAALTRIEMCRQIQNGDHRRHDFARMRPETLGSPALNMKLPDGAKFEIEMQWGHIGWSVPATLGYAVKARDRRVGLMVGDRDPRWTVQQHQKLGPTPV